MLSLQDPAFVGVAGSAPSYSLLWEETQGGEQQILKDGGNIAAGIAFFTGHDMIDEVPKKITCFLKIDEGAVGSATLKLIASDNTPKTK